MIPHLTRPPVGFGPGSQPAEGEEAGLDYLPLPSGMRVYEPHLPEVTDPAAQQGALALLARLAEACDAVAGGAPPIGFDLADLTPADRRLLDETLGEGEVSLRVSAERDAPRVEAQESVFAGVWRVRAFTRHGEPLTDRVEVAAIPASVPERQLEAAGSRALPPLPWPPGVVNGPAILTELRDRAASPSAEAPHVINLSLLPHTPEDLAFLERGLGQGPVVILSRGYGNCRIEATRLPGTWRVRYYNSMDALILDTIEVTPVPAVACAAPEDLAGSAARLREVLEAIR